MRTLTYKICYLLGLIVFIISLLGLFDFIEMEDIDLAYSFMISLIFLSLYTIQKATFIYNKYRESEEFIEEMYKKFKELEENEDGTEMP